MIHRHERARLLEWAKASWDVDLQILLDRAELIRKVGNWQEMVDPECGTTFYHNPVRRQHSLTHVHS